MKKELLRWVHLWPAMVAGALALALAGCSGNFALPETGNADVPDPGEGLTEEPGYTAEALRSDLESAGAQVESGADLANPIFPVSGREFIVNGAAVEVFQFENRAAQELVSGTLADGEDLRGVEVPDWQGEVTFWARDRLIVVYAGQDPGARDLLTQALGEPIRTMLAGAAAATQTQQADTPEAESLQVYLVAVGDEGRLGREIGCGDSLVPVTVGEMPAGDPVRAALEALLAFEESDRQGYYDALAQSDIRIDEATVQEGLATVRLSGQPMLGGVCDTPRFQEQLRETVLQFESVDQVEIFLNGEPVEEALSERGG